MIIRNESGLVLVGGRGKSTDAVGRSDYLKRVADAGFSLDLAFIERGAVMAVGAAKEGARNRTLHRQSLELIRCGLEPVVLLEPALASGLPVAEARKAISSAVQNFSDSYGSTVLDRSLLWLEHWRQRTRVSFSLLLAGVAAHAVEQNTTSPMIVQSALAHTASTQSTVSRRLQALSDRGAVVKKWRGRDAVGRPRPLYYEIQVPKAPSSPLAAYASGAE